jgi:hypothetical protein
MADLKDTSAGQNCAKVPCDLNEKKEVKDSEKIKSEPDALFH